MGLELSARQALSQKQVMSPQMWMGLNLLALPIGELRDAVKKEVESNPAIEDVEFSPIFIKNKLALAQAGTMTDNIAAEDNESLEEHLLSELSMHDIPAEVRPLCEKIIENLDENGRFVGSIPDIVMITGASEKEIEKARRFVMTLDPMGCAAKDLVECFSAQLSKLPKEGAKLLEKELPFLMSGKISPEAVKLLKKLDPFPGKLFDHEKPVFVNPDVFVDKSGNVTIETKDIPDIHISPKYLEMAKDKTIDAETRKYAAERVIHAREFRAALERRQQTLETIATLAISGQKEALEKGVKYLKRQTMSEVAKKAKCHVATVSRAAARKYVKTPFGVLPLRKFFQKGEVNGLEALKKLIFEHLEKEGTLPSDRILAEEMAAKGEKMARRTVAKYRAKLYNIKDKEQL